MNQITNETECSFCGLQNKCMANSEEACWCNAITIPKELIDLIPKNNKGKSCVCLGCIEAYKKKPKNFKNDLNHSAIETDSN